MSSIDPLPPIAELVFNIASEDAQICEKRESLTAFQNLQDYSKPPVREVMIRSLLEGLTQAITSQREAWELLRPQLTTADGQLNFEVGTSRYECSVQFVAAKLNSGNIGYDDFGETTRFLVWAAEGSALPNVEPGAKATLISGSRAYDLICHDSFRGQQYWVEKNRS